MVATTLQRVTRQIRDTLARQSVEELTDGDLLHRFTTQEDETAFAQLVLRHGPMVLGVSRRLLHNPHDAEDVFQAAFLLLARNAAGIHSHNSVAAWLFAVARRLALRVRSADVRRSFHETQVRTMASPTFDEAPHDDELRAILDQELARMPNKYRAPLVLCYLEGLGRAEAARRLGWKSGTTKIRLERGRNLLRKRLVARGLGSVGLGTFLGTSSSTASAQVVQATVRAAVSLARGETAGGLVSARALALMASMRTVAFLARLKLAALLLVATGLLGVGLPWFVHPTVFAEPPVARAEAAPPAEAPPEVRGDQFGDPLPADARARLGTTRLRHETPIVFAAYTPDGKQVVTVSAGGVIYRWDAETGKELPGCGRRLPGLRSNAAALAPDGKTMAFAAGTEVIIWNLETGELLRRWQEPATALALAYGLDGKVLLGRAGTQAVIVWNVADGKELRKFVEPPGNPGGFVFGNKLGVSADGKVVAVPSSVGAANKVRRWEIETGKELAAVTTSENTYARPIFAPDGKTMAWIPTGTGILSLWDMETNKEIRTFDEPLTGMAADVVFSPDGKLVAAVTRESAVCLWDVATGKVQRKLTTLSRAYGRDILAFSTDGRRLALGSGDVLRQFDVATGKELDGPAGHRGPLSATALTPDGKTAITAGADATLRVWDAATGKPRHRWDLPTAALTALTPDGRTLALGGADRVHVWDATAGQERVQWKLAEKTLGGLAVSPDGKLVAARVFDRTIRLWDAVSGKEIYSIADPEGATLPGGMKASANFQAPSLGLAFSPDGTTLATFPIGAPFSGTQRPQEAPKAYAVHLWNAANGRLIRRFESTPLAVKKGAFSPDGRTLATLNAATVLLWETASGKERLEIKVGNADSVCFTPDGKALLVGGVDGVVRLYETAAGKEVGQRTGHRSGVRSLAVSTDGKTLVSGSADATGLVWDLPRLEPARVPVPEQAQMPVLWKDLADPDPAKGYAAARSLTAAPERTWAWLKERLEPVAAPDPEKLRKWIADLDSSDFELRQTAEDELTRLGELAELSLTKAMAGQPGLETKQRIDRLLQARALPENQLRMVRALAILEEIGTPEARELVGRIAAGAEGAQVTRDAKATLGRLARTTAEK